MKLIKLPYGQQWLRIAGRNYGLRTVTMCACGLTPHETLIIEGESHDEEPWISGGCYRCPSCGIEGSWEPAEDAGQIVGDTGIATPDKLLLR